MNKDFIASILGAKGTQEFDNRLKMFSLSEEDAAMRRKAFADTIAQTMEINDRVAGRSRRSFAGGASLSSANLAGVSIYAGVMRSFVQSIAPIFAVQRNIDAPSQKIMYVDFYDILNNELIVPNIGADRAWADKKRHTIDTITPGSTSTIVPGTPLVPKTFRAEVYNVAGTTRTLVGTIVDGGNGKFLATPGMIKDTSKIEYNNGGASTIQLDFEAGLTATQLEWVVVYDVPGDDEVNKAYGNVKYYDVDTTPILVPVERNVIADHAMAKQGIINQDELYANFIENEYTKVVNQRVFDALVQGYSGDTFEVDLSSFSLASGFYDTIVRTFKSALAQAENQLAAQTFKGAKCTGYLASPEAVNVFDYMTPGDGWVKNMNSTYYKDIVGWYNDVPVVRCLDLPAGELMLTVRTDDGYVAPLFHAMFLAPTELPVVANYQNMTKYASGMYSMEGFGFSSSALCVKLKIKTPAELGLKKL